MRTHTMKRLMACGIPQKLIETINAQNLSDEALDLMVMVVEQAHKKGQQDYCLKLAAALQSRAQFCPPVV